jgi:hypothetical protein
MLQYLNNIIPRIQRYSKSLDKVEVFVDKPWVLQDECNNIHEYMFLRDNRLILSVNGIVKEGRWELLPNGKLLINRVDDQVLLQNMFIDDAVMILKLSGTTDIPFTLLNEQKIPDRDIMKYLQEAEQRLSLQQKQDISLSNKQLLENGRITGSVFKIGERIDGDGQEVIITGTYLSTNSTYQQYVVVNNNIVMQSFFKVPYQYFGKKIEVVQKNVNDLMVNDRLADFILPSFQKEAVIELRSQAGKLFKIKINGNGTILHVYKFTRQDIQNFVIIVLVLLALVILQRLGI